MTDYGKFPVCERKVESIVWTGHQSYMFTIGKWELANLVIQRAHFFCINYVISTHCYTY